MMTTEEIIEFYSTGKYFYTGDNTQYYDTGKYRFNENGILETIPFYSVTITQNNISGDVGVKGLGDLVSSIATPVARLLKMSCIDPHTKQLRVDSPCARRKAALNGLMPFTFQ